MGLFSGKKKVPISAVVEDLTRTVVRAYSHDKMKELCEDTLGIELNEQQRLEWLALNMWVVTKAVQNAIKDEALRNRILDAFHAATYLEVLDNDRQRVALETLLKERYTEYFEILQSRTNSVEALGFSFAKHFSTMDIAAILLATTTAFQHLKILRDYLVQTSTQFDIV